MFLFSSPSGIKRLFPDGQNVPSEMEMSGDIGCNIRLEPLFEGVEDKNLERWYVARFSSEISSERVAAELAGRDNITKIQYNKIIRKAPGEVSACVEEDVPVRNVRFAGGMNKKMETISDLHFQCSLRGSNPRPQH